VERLTDWSNLWRQLVELRARGQGSDPDKPDFRDPWAERARDFSQRVGRKWSSSDSSRALVASLVEPGTTVLDIGAGTGAWSIMLAAKAARVTAIDASPAMLRVMHENLAAQGVANVDVIAGRWPDVAVEPHDYSLCAHAMYGSPDLPAFVAAMMRATRRTCFMMMRSPVHGGILEEAAVHVLGMPLDSPNFTIGYNVLLQMGLAPNVLMETRELWDARTSASLEDALARLKRHFGLSDSTEHDAYFRDLLSRRLEPLDGRFGWGRDVRTALVYWDVA